MKTFKEFISEALPFGAIVSTSSYGPGLYGNPTASGQKLTPTTRGVAHKKLPLGSKVKITDPKTGRSVVAPVVDRGPYHGNRQYDLTTQTTRDLGYKDYKQFGVRDLDVTPVKPEKPKPKIPDLGIKVDTSIPKIVPTKKK
jgi:rare lipoprotein A (peptidoglycan hydrolase)